MTMEKNIWQIKLILVQRLKAKGIGASIIPGYIRDLGNFYSSDPQISLMQANQRLHYLGWDDVELDYHTFQLAVACLETGAMAGSRL